jgi:nicotinate-nucleotide adenylyltransferase
MKLGFFGGSFDPVHKAHIALALAAQRELGLDRVYFIPAGLPPHKLEGLRSSAAHRIKMLKLALSGYPKFQISLWEIRRGGVSYTERTLRAFRRRFPKAEWYLIVGGDSLSNFTAWRRWKYLLKQSPVVVGVRPKAAMKKIPKTLQSRTIVLKTKLPDISSTEVRERVRHGRSIRSLVPAAVGRYIEGQNLYGNTKEIKQRAP